MSAKVVEEKDLGNGRRSRLAFVDAADMHRKVKETIGFIQAFCASDPLEALAVAQMTLAALKEMFGIEGDIELMQNRPQ